MQLLLCAFLSAGGTPAHIFTVFICIRPGCGSFLCPAATSDGFGLTDKIRKFVVSGVWQQHANNSCHDADCAKNKVWEDLVVNTHVNHIRTNNAADSSSCGGDP